MTAPPISTAASGAAQAPREITDDLDLLLEALPEEIYARLRQLERADLLEVVLDLGRRPEVRFAHGAQQILEREVSETDIAHVIEHIGVFGDDNRAGIERTLHRISAIRNRSGKVVGLTCRIGRAVFGTIDIIRDVVEAGDSILILGRPGVGKTTMLREVARVLADEFSKRVVIVDTSNEIAGDGDIPHPGIGNARRMQVRTPTEQHSVMIEAVENHMPEVIVIDEIGTELEAAAARTIAERGVQLVGTAHGITLDNLMLNPTLSDLVGGIQPVTLGDEEARHRGTQKTVLERQSPPTFDVLVEIVARDHVVVHHNVAETVDTLLRGNIPTPESRWRDEHDKLRRETNYHYQSVEAGASFAAHEVVNNGLGSFFSAEYQRPRRKREQGKTRHGMDWSKERSNRRRIALQPLPGETIGGLPVTQGNLDDDAPLVRVRSSSARVKIFPFGISSKRIEQAAAELELPIKVAHEVEDADAVMTLANHYRRRPAVLREAEAANKPVYVLRSNSMLQIESLLTDLFGLEVNPQEAALQEAAEAIGLVRASGSPRQLSPQNAYIRRLQHQLAERESLMSRSRGHEPRRRVELLAP